MPALLGHGAGDGRGGGGLADGLRTDFAPPARRIPARSRAAAKLAPPRRLEPLKRREPRVGCEDCSRASPRRELVTLPEGDAIERVARASRTTRRSRGSGSSGADPALLETSRRGSPRLASPGLGTPSEEKTSGAMSSSRKTRTRGRRSSNRRPIFAAGARVPRKRTRGSWFFFGATSRLDPPAFDPLAFQPRGPRAYARPPRRAALFLSVAEARRRDGPALDLGGGATRGGRDGPGGSTRRRSRGGGGGGSRARRVRRFGGFGRGLPMSADALHAPEPLAARRVRRRRRPRRSSVARRASSGSGSRASSRGQSSALPPSSSSACVARETLRRAPLLAARAPACTSPLRRRVGARPGFARVARSRHVERASCVAACGCPASAAFASSLLLDLAISWDSSVSARLPELDRAHALRERERAQGFARARRAGRPSARARAPAAPRLQRASREHRELGVSVRQRRRLPSAPARRPPAPTATCCLCCASFRRSPVAKMLISPRARTRRGRRGTTPRASPRWSRRCARRRARTRRSGCGSSAGSSPSRPSRASPPPPPSRRRRPRRCGRGGTSRRGRWTRKTRRGLSPPPSRRRTRRVVAAPLVVNLEHGDGRPSTPYQPSNAPRARENRSSNAR